jgi:hypothetical protein
MRSYQTYDPALVPEDIRKAPAFLDVKITTTTGEVVYKGELMFRQFNTGSWGWMDAGKANVPNSPNRRMQVNVQLVVIGSKPGSDKGPRP